MKILALIFYSVGLFAVDNPPYDKEAVRLKIKENMTAVLDCYNKTMQPNAVNNGKVVLEWDITDTGSLSQVRIKEDRTTLKNPALHLCIIEHLKTLKFPPTAKGNAAHIIYPFEFRQKTL